MKKQLPTQMIANELTGASVFFQSPTPQRGEAVQPPQQETPPVHPTSDVSATPTVDRAAPLAVQPPSQASPTPTIQPTTQPENQATMTPRHHDTVIPSKIETLRKAVKQMGKEAATHRFTAEEKQTIADILYSYARRGYRTSENEIARIAINWLLLDYKTNGTASILDQVLRSLKE